MARDPSIDWSEKKKVMDSIFQRRASTGRQLHELEKQSQALSTTILAKQQQVCERALQICHAHCRAHNVALTSILPLPQTLRLCRETMEVCSSCLSPTRPVKRPANHPRNPAQLSLCRSEVRRHCGEYHGCLPR